MKNLRIVLLGLLALPWGCSAASHAGPGPEPRTGSEPASGCDRAGLAACEAELREKAETLQGTLGLLVDPDGVGQAKPAADCRGAPSLRDRICALAAAICQLSARNPDSSELRDKCEAAQASCERARSDVGRACAM